MTVENIEAFDGYVDNSIISKQSLALLDEMQIEWRGRNVSEIYDDVRMKAILMAAQEYNRCSQKNPASEHPRIKSEAIEFIADVFSIVKTEPKKEDSNIVSHLDPISGARKVSTLACSHLKNISDEQKVIGRNLEHALQADGFKSYRLDGAFSVKT